MRKLALLAALAVFLTSCAKQAAETSSTSVRVVTGSTSSSSAADPSKSTSSEDASGLSKSQIEAAAAAASEAVESEMSISETTSQMDAEAVPSETAASQAAASEAAASEAAAQAASEAAAFEAAAQAASEAAASEAAARAASEAAASEAEARAASEAAEKAAAKKASKTVSVTGSNFLPDIERQVLELQNEERTRLGLQPLEFDADLQSAARIRSRELCKAEVFVHARPDGREWYTVLQEDVPYDYRSAGENLGNAEYNDPSVDLANDADFWVDSWIDSPSHYQNMIRAEYNRAGVGIYSVERDGMTYAYATTIFARVE